MHTTIPHFRRRTGCGPDKHSEFIDMNGECVHRIRSMKEFYEAFGYSSDMAKAGVLPDEFIWEEYIRDRDLTHTECLQIHLIEYLMDHSEQFRKNHSEQSAKWIVAHLEMISSTLCPECKMKPFCSARINEATGYFLS